MSKPLAKSLHTVSVLVNVARLMQRVFPQPSDAVREALHVLGYSGAADPYGLAARAAAILEKDAQ